MHELAATMGMIEIVRSECEKGGIKAPHDICLELGQLTPYVKECVAFYFETLRDDEGWPKARLHIKVVKGMVKCRRCGKKGSLKDGILLYCTKCESTDVEIIRGREFKIAKITGE
ncbi:MAG: hydrogenase maturation nickel metallochaperone HypA [Candidatus Altiarchaeota archaeon]